MRRLAAVTILLLSALNVTLISAQRPPSPPAGGRPGGGGVQPNCIGCGGGGSPYEVLDAPIGNVFTPSPYIDIQFCKASYGLDASTRLITLNGVDRTSSFSYTSGDPHADCTASSGNAYSTTTSLTLDAGSNTLYAYICDDLSHCGGHTWTITFITSVTPTGPVVARDLCLTIAVGPSAAYECGDLRIVHALPAVRTMGRVRAPTLLYSSQQAHPFQSLSGDLTLATSSTSDSIIATARVNAGAGFAQRDREVWTGSQWGPTGQAVTRRVMTDFSLGDLVTGIYPYQLEIAKWTGAGGYATIRTDTGSVVVVNRFTSPFGAGWWLAGFEQLQFPSGGAILWTGGDGSVRRYVNAGSWSGKTWYIARALDGPDTLSFDGSTYTRLLKGGNKVVFNSSGFHTQTVSRLGYATVFAPDGSNRLSTITMPPSTSGLTYTFTYSGPNGTLSSVAAPDTSVSGSRTTAIGGSSVTGGERITTITDPGSSAYIQFTYGNGSYPAAITARTDRRSATTSYTYGTGLKLVGTSLAVPGAATISLSFCPAEIRVWVCSGGLTSPESTYTVYDGPRTDSADITHFWLDTLGAVTQIRDAYAQITTIARGDSRWPVLPTQVTAANGFVTQATYDSRGNLASTTAVSPLGGGNATTSYTWDQKWDAVTNTLTPEGVATTTSYDANTGNRSWIQDGSGSSSQVNFYYSAANRVIAVMSPGGSVADSIRYDTLGNVSRTRSPIGFQTLYDGDRLGRITRVRTPTDSIQSAWREERTFFDGRGLDTLTESRGGGDTVRVRKWFDAEGNVDSLRRWAAPDSASVGNITTRWLYDLAGRANRETAPDGVAENRTFDPAGNLTQVVTRRGETVSMLYDAMGRLRQRIVPAVVYDSNSVGIGSSNLSGYHYSYPWYPTDSVTRQLRIPRDTATFSYDVMGNLLTARNAVARTMRQYFANNQLRRDTSVILSWTGSDSTLHRYGISYGYDLDGRLRVVRHPVQLAPQGAAGRDTVLYVYSTRGFLSDVYDLQGNRFEFQYDARGRQTAIVMATAGITQSLGYDADDRLFLEAIANTRNDTTQLANRFHFPMDSLRARTFRYREPGRVWQANDRKGWVDSSTATYTGLGQLAELFYKIPYAMPWGGSSVQTSDEQFTNDALGNTTQTTTSSSTGAIHYHYQSTSSPRYQRYYAGTGRLRATSQFIDGASRLDSMLYDPAGNLAVSWTATWQSATLREDRVSYYGADGMLHAAETRSQTGQQTEGPWQMVFEEFRYDALGRRVAVRTRRACQAEDNAPTGNGCWLGTIRRAVWDGAQELWEIQAPGGTSAYDSTRREIDTTRINYDVYTSKVPADFVDPDRQFGRVGYTHAAGLDQPLSATRLAYTDWIWDLQSSQYVKVDWAPFTLVPLWNWRGHPELTVFADTGSNNDGNYHYCTSTAATRCLPMRWRPVGTAQSGLSLNNAPWHWFAWYGGLTEQKEDGTGTFYRRNRYLDPTTGRFTQEDPIGLSGGLNLYGFASGDPVNFSDPFGLCVPWPWCHAQEAAEFWAGRSAGSTGLARAGANLMGGMATLVSDGKRAALTGLTLVTAGVASSVISGAGGGGAALAADATAAESGVSEGALGAMERQLATAGRRSLERTIRSLTSNIAEHEARMAEYRAAGGDVASMEREVSAWRQTIEAARKVLGAN